MDGQRFDNLAKSLAGRLSRRNALRRAGAAASATLLASAGVRAAPAVAQRQDEPVYTVIRRYTLDSPTNAVRAALQQGYIEDACKAPGFIAYFSVEDEDGDFATVAVFRSQDDFENSPPRRRIGSRKTWGICSPRQTRRSPGIPTSMRARRRRSATPAPPRRSRRRDLLRQPLPAPRPQRRRRRRAPTATPTPAPCTGQGCVCSTGTRRPCDRGFICCPTSDVPGGPGVCQTREVCYPNQCVENGGACDPSCGADDACPSCCSNYCNDSGQCADAPAPPCTAAGCDCTTGTQSPCDAGLICCGTTGTPGGPGTCQTEAECNAPCTGEGCACTGGVQGNCDAGLVCCQGGQPIPGGAGTCEPEAECSPAPCTGQGCACNGGVQAPAIPGWSAARTA